MIDAIRTKIFGNKQLRFVIYPRRFRHRGVSTSDKLFSLQSSAVIKNFLSRFPIEFRRGKPLAKTPTRRNEALFGQ